MANESPVDRELEAIVALAGGDPMRAYQVVEHQLSVLVVRTQVLLSLSGIVVTVTGFSGRAIAATSPSARMLIATGIGVVLLAAAVAIAGVLRLKWLTQLGGSDWRSMLRCGLETRATHARISTRICSGFLPPVSSTSITGARSPGASGPIRPSMKSACFMPSMLGLKYWYPPRIRPTRFLSAQLRFQ